MKKIYPPIVLIVLMALSTFTFGQTPQSTYEIHLKNGTIPVRENVDAIAAGRIQPEDNDFFGDRAYFCLQFNAIPTQEERKAIDAADIHLMDYLPDNAYLASLPADLDPQILPSLGIRAVLRPDKYFRFSPDIFDKKYPEHALQHEGVDLKVSFYRDVDRAAAMEDLHKRALVVDGNINKTQVTIRVPIAEVHNLIALPYLSYVGAIPPESTPDDTEGRSLHRSNVIASDYGAGRHYDGTGMTIGLADDGPIGPHIDYTGRYVDSASNPNGSHGDMTAGILFGAGNRDPKVQGHAFGAFLYYWRINGYPQVNDAVGHINSHNLLITSTSYSQGSGGVYTTDTEFIDDQIYTNPELIHVFSAGNAGNNWTTITGGYKAGKNVMTCANLRNQDQLENSSSRGPTADGRIKPDISANGYRQLSTDENNTNQLGGGTSAACPSIAGITTQLYHAYRELNSQADPESPLIKATMLNSAEDLLDVGPDYETGWGRVNALRAVRVLENNWYTSSTIAQGNANQHTISVPSGLGQLKVMVYWLDYAGNPAASTDLVNNLNMTVTRGGTTYNPWVLNPNNPGSPATTGVDNLNNMEQVVVNNPTSGTYTVNVAGASVPQGPQKYYVVWSFIDDDIEVTYPIGGEGFVPGEDELLRWDAVGTTGNFTIQYTTNNGASWTTIASNVGGAERYYAWTVPNNVTGLGKIRVTRGGLTGTTIENFAIIDTPPNLNVDFICPTSIGLSWTAVTGAAFYEVSHLGSMYMDSVGTSATTSIVVNGLNPNQDHWFSVRAITTTGQPGRRAVAIFQAGGVFNCPIPIDAELTTLSPSTGQYNTCLTSDSVPVVLDITNAGTTTLTNVPVHYRFNGGTIFNEIATGSLTQGSTTSHTFASTIDLSIPGTYTLEAWVNYSNDGNVLNDTIVANIVVGAGTVVSLPYTEDFESFPLCGVNTNCGATVCGLANGWVNATNGTEDDHDWRTDEGGTASNNTGPDLDHNPGTATGNYLYTEASGGCDSAITLLNTPCIDLAGANLPLFEFWYHAYGGNMGELHIDIFSNGSWDYDVITPISGNQGNQWRQVVINLSTYANQTISIRFRGITGDDFESDLAIDDIKVYDIFGPPSSDFNASATQICGGEVVTMNDASQFGPANWNWSITPATHTYVNGTSNSSQNPQVLFNAAGTYSVQLITGNQYGFDTLVKANYVTVVAGATLPITEDFESFATCGTNNDCGTTVCPLANGWTNAANGTEDDIDWRTDDGGTASQNTGPTIDHNPGTAAGNYVYLEASGGCNGQEALMLSNCIDLTTASAPTMDFWYHMFGGDMGELHVDIQDSSGWNLDVMTPITGNQGNNWQQASVSLGSYVGQTIVIRFRGITGTGFESDIALDDINIYNSIVLPIAFFQGAPLQVCTGQPADFVDQSGNTPTSWQWSVAPATVSFVNGTTPTSQNPSIRFNAPGQYSITLIASNGNGSDTLTQTNYVQALGGTALPITEDFESFTLCGTNFDCGTTVCGLANGWTNLTNGSEDDVDWRTNEGGTPSNNTGPTTDHNPGTATGNYLYLEASNNCFGQEALMTSGCINLGSAVNPTMDFWYHMWGFSMGELHVDVLDSTGWNLDAMPPLLGDQGNQWSQGSVPLAGYAGQTIVIRFRGITGTDYASDISIDDINIYDNIFPPASDFVGDTTVVCTGGVVNFTDLSTNQPTSWQWTVAPNTITYTQGSATTQNPSIQFNAAGTYTVELIATNPYGSDTTVKTAYVQAVSGAALPFTEDFQLGLVPPANWSLVDPGGALTWTDASVPGPSGVTTIAAFMENFNYNNQGAEDALRTPLLTMPSGTNPVIWLSFDVAYARFNGQFFDGLRVDVSTDCGATWNPTSYFKEDTILATAPDAGGVWAPANPNEWRKDSVDLSAFGGQDIMLSFVNINGWGNSLYLDNINLTGTILMAPVSDFTFNSPVCAGQTVTFNDASTGGQAATWDWDFTGGTPATATGAGPHNVTYSAGGTYTVTLTVTNAAGTDTQTQTVTVDPTVNTSISIVQSGGPNPACVGDLLEYTATGIGGGANALYNWKVNGSSVQNGASANFSSSTLSNGDVVTCDLTSSEVCASPNVSVSNALTVNIQGTTPSALFNFSNGGSNGGTYDFTDLSSGTPTSWTWLFGDGNTSSVQNPSHNYTTSGSYNVTLIVSNNCGSDTVTVTLNGVVSVDPGLFGGADVAVYPNPSAGLFIVNITGSTASEVEWNITDLHGRILLSGTQRIVNGAMEERFDLTDFSEGLYLLKLKADGIEYVRKLIRQ